MRADLGTHSCTAPILKPQNRSRQVAHDEQETRPASRPQRCLSHEDQLPVHEARELIALQPIGIK
jgi:hypothetical protein